MTMNTLSGRIYGGAFDLAGTQVNGKGTPQVRAKVALQQIQMSELLGGGIAGNQVKGPLSINLAANGAGASEADIMRSLRGKGDIGGTVMVIGKIEQTVGSTLLGVLGQQVKQVQGVANTVNGVLSSFTGVDNDVSGTFNINKGTLVTRDFTFVNPRARGAADGRIDLAAWAMKMLVDLYGADANRAFMSLNLTGPVDGPKVAFAPGAAAGPTGLMGLAPGGQFTPNNLLQQIPGVGNLLGGQLAPVTQPVQPTEPGGVLQPGALQPSTSQPGDVLEQLLGTQPAPAKKKKKKAATAPLLESAPGSVLLPAPEQGGVLEPGALPPSP
jgi:hypothetical protein